MYEQVSRSIEVCVVCVPDGGARAGDLPAALGQGAGAVVAVAIEQVGRGLTRRRRA